MLSRLPLLHSEPVTALCRTAFTPSAQQRYTPRPANMPATNSAAWITAPKATPLQVYEAPYPKPGPRDVIVKNAAVAINPLEYKIQDTNPPIGGKSFEYPTILGADLAGTIVEVGSEVRTHQVGERVIANASGAATPAMSAFQNFVQLHESSLTPLPDHVTFEAGSVLPLACDTAMAGLFAEGQLNLSTNRLGDPESRPPPPGSALLVWGGSSSVGCCAIQMATAAGYEVYTTASKRNHALCRSLGAAKVFDHADANTVGDMIEALQGKPVVGAYDCVVDQEKTILPLVKILQQSNGPKLISCVLTPPETEFPGGVKAQRCQSRPNHAHVLVSPADDGAQ